MAIRTSRVMFPALTMVVLLTILTAAPHTSALIPYRSPLWEMMLPMTTEDPFRILEQSPLSLNLPKATGGTDAVALARADWKETPTSHVITVDIPGMKKDDVKIEVEEGRLLRISGERKLDAEVEGERWHRAERAAGKFWRQFRLPVNADLEHVRAHLEDGVLKITVPKFAEEKRKQNRVVDIAGSESAGEDVRPTKAATASAS